MIDESMLTPIMLQYNSSYFFDVASKVAVCILAKLLVIYRFFMLCWLLDYKYWFVASAIRSLGNFQCIEQQHFYTWLYYSMNYETDMQHDSGKLLLQACIYVIDTKPSTCSNALSVFVLFMLFRYINIV